MALKSIGAIIGLALVAIVIAAFMPRPTAEQQYAGANLEQSAEAKQPEPQEKPEIVDVRVGSGRVVEQGDMVSVHYEVYLSDGTKIDSSRPRGRPLKFLFGGGTVMPGWDIGLRGVREGGKRRLVVPPKLAYGDKGSEDGKVPPNATLRFDIEIIKAEKLSDEPLLDPLLRGTELDKSAGK